MQNNMFLEDKRVLFVGFQYYDYHIHITNALKKAGANVRFFSVEKYWFPYNYVFTFLRNTNTKLWFEFNNAYSRSILEKTRNEEFDYVFIIQGFQHDEKFYKQLRRQNPNAVFLSYQWDPVMDTVFGRTYLEAVPYFDKVYSFDKRDVETYGNLHYLPLFYSDAYGDLANDTSSASDNVDLLFIGTLWKMRRYNYLKKIKDICESQGINFTHYLYCGGRLYVKSLLKGRIIKDVRLKSLNQNQIINYYKNSKVIVDLPHLHQTGLAMRVFEVLGSGRKLITTNQHIAKEPFYDEKYISIIDPENPSLDLNFIKEATIGRNPKIEQYSISNWLRNIFIFD